MQRALSQQTEDAQLYYHAGMIALALADSDAAMSHLSEAMRLDARFSPSQSLVARRVIESLHTHLTVIPSERSESITLPHSPAVPLPRNSVIPSERSESRDLHSAAPPARMTG